LKFDAEPVYKEGQMNIDRDRKQRTKNTPHTKIHQKRDVETNEIHGQNNTHENTDT
jgi:hypothetical protein